MPIIATFAGIVIRMYFLESEHNPPHIQFGAAIDIRTLQILDGFLPTKEHRLVAEWMQIHQEELLDIWDTQVFRKLPPL